MSSILKVDEIQDTSGNNIINENANTITIGKSGDTVALASGATQSGFGLSGWSEDGANNNLLPASASAGIYLGVNSATASNLLDDYEEGTWTPSITGATGVTNLTGRYRKVGSLVTVWVYMESGNIGGSPQYLITGLPFTVDEVRSTTSSVASVDIFASNATSVYGLLPVNNTQIEFLYNQNNSGWLAQNISTGTDMYLHFSASYIAN